jgi:hypothetical protein
MEMPQRNGRGILGGLGMKLDLFHVQAEQARERVQQSGDVEGAGGFASDVHVRHDVV